jgi:hypothetical protein
MKTLQLMVGGGGGGKFKWGLLSGNCTDPCHTICQTAQSNEEGRGQIVFVLTALKVHKNENFFGLELNFLLFQC